MRKDEDLHRFHLRQHKVDSLAAPFHNGLNCFPRRSRLHFCFQLVSWTYELYCSTHIWPTIHDYTLHQCWMIVELVFHYHDRGSSLLVPWPVKTCRSPLHKILSLLYKVRYTLTVYFGLDINCFHSESSLFKTALTQANRPPSGSKMTLPTNFSTSSLYIRQGSTRNRYIPIRSFWFPYRSVVSGVVTLK